jgi:hypothetical protein
MTPQLYDREVVLAEGLSNSRLEHLFEHLTTPAPAQPQAPRARTRSVAPDGRRKCGSVSNAIIKVLSGAKAELRVRDIQKRVEGALGSPVSRGSVKGYLHRRSRGQGSVFERTARGCYRLIRD